MCFIPTTRSRSIQQANRKIVKEAPHKRARMWIGGNNKTKGVGWWVGGSNVLRLSSCLIAEKLMELLCDTMESDCLRMSFEQVLEN